MLRETRPRESVLCNHRLTQVYIKSITPRSDEAEEENRSNSSLIGSFNILHLFILFCCHSSGGGRFIIDWWPHKHQSIHCRHQSLHSENSPSPERRRKLNHSLEIYVCNDNAATLLKSNLRVCLDLGN